MLRGLILVCFVLLCLELGRLATRPPRITRLACTLVEPVEELQVIV